MVAGAFSYPCPPPPARSSGQFVGQKPKGARTLKAQLAHRVSTYFILQTGHFLSVKRGIIDNQARTTGLNWDSPQKPGQSHLICFQTCPFSRNACLGHIHIQTSVLANTVASTLQRKWKPLDRTALNFLPRTHCPASPTVLL